MSFFSNGFLTWAAKNYSEKKLKEIRPKMMTLISVKYHSNSLPRRNNLVRLMDDHRLTCLIKVGTVLLSLCLIVLYLVSNNKQQNESNADKRTFGGSADD